MLLQATLAKPIPDFAPLYKDDPSGPKTVDFSINLATTRGSSLESAIHTLPHEPPHLSVNQTLNEAYKKPAVVSIDTKKGFYEEEDAKFKLGMWTAAWQNRVAAFRPREKVVCTPLLGLIVFGHEWWLYGVVDQDTRVDILEFPISIGCTRTVTGCYLLLATIRYLLGVWTPDAFLPWLREKILGLEGRGVT
ncbi:hypothetical protein BU23DRAFT_510707 [Bimuria novae-zelandiae CBS 107.79]|uniref:PD-(D/E)XK nuclease-like domain-containing protein n=1 Tax=Bimuria novae-zelandiae CBS 107.79 TaxID=1447943 RepID=A0A6A5V2W0_9PLEO|nr:hypothetical protein BU23DRAFT_510707 [Bimuria novae-zelandiae CBS 107.79]